MKITIIGAGNMGRAIASRAVAGGHDVEIADHTPEKAQALAEEVGGTALEPGGKIGGEVVVLAVYYPALAAALDEYHEQLGGKVVVDISNPIDFETFEGLAVPPDSSAAEEAAQRVPDASVVKAFNTTFANTLVPGEAHGQQLDVFIAGDDQAAKAKVRELIETSGLRAIDVGPLRRARQLEQLGFLHISLQEPLGTGFASALKVHP
ncbi:MAG: NADPH-dependent F420 reductase [Actinomycetota bacterium]|nr:NADPH-dependent F420 reductase [Actinomycetota bacterium]